MTEKPKTNNDVKPERILSIMIGGVWAFIVIFAIVSLSEPDWLTMVSKKNKREEVGTMIKNGVALSRKGEEQKAIQTYKEALEIMPSFAEAKVNMGVSYKRLHKYDKAIELFREALAMSPPDSSNIYSNLGDVYSALGDTVKARKYFQKAMESEISIISRLMKEGNFYFRKKNWGKALKFYERCLNKRFDMKNHYISTLKKARVDYVREPKELKSIKSLLTESEKRINKRLHRFDSSAFIKTVKQDKGLAVNYNKVGFCLARTGRFDEAIDCFYKALEVWSDYRDAKLNVRYILEKRDKLD